MAYIFESAINTYHEVLENKSGKCLKLKQDLYLKTDL